MKDKEPIDEVCIVLEKDHDGGLVFCDLCGTRMTKGHKRFEQWGSKVRIMAENFPIYTCSNDGIEWCDGEANLEFLQKELTILKEKNDQGYRQATREAIRLAQQNLRLSKE